MQNYSVVVNRLQDDMSAASSVTRYTCRQLLDDSVERELDQHRQAPLYEEAVKVM